MGFPILAAIRTSYEVLSEGLAQPVSAQWSFSISDASSYMCNLTSTHVAQLQEQLQTLISHLRGRLNDSRPISSGFAQMDHVPGSPIFSIRCPFPRQLAAYCQAKGYTVRAIMSPTVPAGKERVRVCLHAGNTREEIDGLVDALLTCLEDLDQRKTLKL